MAQSLQVDDVRAAVRVPHWEACAKDSFSVDRRVRPDGAGSYALARGRNLQYRAFHVPTAPRRRQRRSAAGSGARLARRASGWRVCGRNRSLQA
jgi:hypothetical protein